MKGAGRRKHIGRDATHTFCGNTIMQETKSGPGKLFVTDPEFCDCRPCLTKYYLQNPLQLKHTVTK